MQSFSIHTIIICMKTGAFIVPTGVGASIGGFAGDASIWARKFAEKCRLIVNPNVVNAACFPVLLRTCYMLKDILWMNFLREIYA